MKKFLKAVALATVMCMLLSVSAFAAVDATAGSAARVEDTKTIDVKVIGAGAGKEVALLIVKSGVELADVVDTDIMFINQDTANGDGAVDFGAVSIKDETQTVDVWVGSAGLQTARMIGENISLADAKKITIVEGADAKIQVKAPGKGGVKYGYAAAITVNVPEGLDDITKMIWAFKVGGVWKYSTSIENPLANAGVVTGGVQFAAAFNAYNVAEDGSTSPVDVTDVAAIFLTGDDATDADNMHYTDDTLKKYQAN